MYEVIIVGGGIAGLSAALILGRCRRRVLVCDSNRPRNARSKGVHGFFSRDGTDPWELRRLGQEQLRPYPTVELLPCVVTDAVCHPGSFEIMLEDGQRFRSRLLLLATGIVDRLPPIDGLLEFYGRSVFHCPYCDGWENRDQPLAVYGRGEEGAAFALEVRGWSADLVLCTDGTPLAPPQQERLARHGIEVRTEPLLRLEGVDGQLERVIFTTGEPLARRGLFFLSEPAEHSPLPQRLGCEMVGGGQAATGKLQETGVPGLFLAGDAAKAVKLAVIAAAEGAEAAFAINRLLSRSEFP